ncbi:MAG: nucleotidyltransferase domain-containing protein [Candidatus Woesearchaeota archaeon]|nr:nucleotidyltransferase domain-containing protein [Candidatus Woesearchaeota archaeon]
MKLDLEPGPLRGVSHVLKKIPGAILGGSTAKGTHLKGDFDIDIFVTYPKGTKNIADKLERTLQQHFTNVRRVHGSRDYFQFERGKYTYEVVPVIAITKASEAENVTDVSPLHVTYVKQHMTKHLANDIRLTKQFCKAAKVYGAESYIGGFSGHVLDLLNIHYGGFKKVISAAATWKQKVVLDIEQHRTKLNAEKTQSPLIIIDPVQPNRNSAAALTKEKYDVFKAAASAYLKKPSSTFFQIKPLTKKGMRGRILHVELTPLQGKKDVVGAKCQKVYEYCKRELTPFTLIESKWEFTDTATLLYSVQPGLLAAVHTITGPPTNMKKDVARFKKKHTNTFTRNGKLYAKEQRTYRDAKVFLQHILKKKYITSRVQKAILH